MSSLSASTSTNIASGAPAKAEAQITGSEDATFHGEDNGSTTSDRLMEDDTVSTSSFDDDLDQEEDETVELKSFRDAVRRLGKAHKGKQAEEGSGRDSLQQDQAVVDSVLKGLENDARSFCASGDVSAPLSPKQHRTEERISRILDAFLDHFQDERPTKVGITSQVIHVIWTHMVGRQQFRRDIKQLCLAAILPEAKEAWGQEQFSCDDLSR